MGADVRSSFSLSLSLQQFSLDRESGSCCVHISSLLLWLVVAAPAPASAAQPSKMKEVGRQVGRREGRQAEGGRLSRSIAAAALLPLQLSRRTTAVIIIKSRLLHGHSCIAIGMEPRIELYACVGYLSQTTVTA